MTAQHLEAADLNLLESIRQHAAWQSPCELVERDGMILMAGATEFPALFRNCAARLDPDLPAPAALDQARDFFGERKRSYTVMVRGSRDADLDSEVMARGYTLRGDSPCMLVEKPVEVPALPTGIRIEPFSEVRHIRDFAQINAEAYQAIGLPADQTLALFSQPEQVLQATPIGFVAYRDGQPAAAALIMGGGECPGVYWVGTASAAQRMGLASICTALATNAAFAAGASAVTLQATAFGEPVYRRLGYQTFDRLKLYRHLGAPA